MKSLRTLAPLFWKYRGRLFAGIIFILLTNVLAVFAPALVGEGINALKDAHDSYLAPGAEISDDSFIALPEILSKVGELTGLDEIWGGEIETKSDVHRLVVLIAILHPPNHHRQLPPNGVRLKGENLLPLSTSRHSFLPI
jgi:ABC-type multidrug transport system fused ATPase/permease subunit